MRPLPLVALVLVGGLGACSKAPTPAISTATEIPISCKSELARELLIQAWDLTDARRRNEALRMAERAHAADPDCVLAEAWRGFLLQGTDGIGILAAAAKRTGELPEAEKKQVEMLVASRNGEPEQALAAIEEIARLVPGSWRAHDVYAHRLAGANRNGEALVELRRAIELAPGQPMPWLRTSQIYGELGRYSEAADAAMKYAEAMPGNNVALEVASSELLRASREAEAETFARRSLAIAPRSGRAWRLLGRARLLQEDRAGAKEAITKALELLGPRDGERLRGRLDGAVLAWLEGDHAAAATRFGAIREGFHSKDVFAAYYAGIGLATHAALACSEGECAEANAILDRVEPEMVLLRKYENDGLMRSLRFAERRSRIAVLARTGRPEDAEAVTLAAVADADKWSAIAAAFGRAEVARARGDTASAEAAYRECAPLEPWCLYELAMLRRQRGDKTAAAEAEQQLAGAQNLDFAGAYFRVSSRR